MSQSHFDKNIADDISHFISNKWSMAIFRYPHSGQINIIAGSLHKIENLREFPAGHFIVSPFRQANHLYCIESQGFKTFNLNDLPRITLPEPAQNNATIPEDQYRDIIREALESIEKEQFKKVVLARRKKVALPAKFNLFDYFTKLAFRYPASFVSYFSSPELGTWIGASPELLFQSDGKTFQTVALAGTKTNDELKNQSGFSEKEIAEQELVSAYIREVLSAYDLKEKQAQIVNAGNVNHIQTCFVSELRKTNYLEIVQNLHPTPAICGYPKKEAADFIHSQEGFDRKLYGGYWGYVTPDNKIQLYVNLRTMELFKGEAVIYAGAGIVSGSDPKLEFMETENKMETLLSLF